MILYYILKSYQARAASILRVLFYGFAAVLAVYFLIAFLMPVNTNWIVTLLP